jgi:hypothetical protein
MTEHLTSLDAPSCSTPEDERENADSDQHSEDADREKKRAMLGDIHRAARECRKSARRMFIIAAYWKIVMEDRSRTPPNPE